MGNNTTDITNTSFQLASDFVNYTQASLFLTGKAGTGKTTFLKHIKENGVKNTVVVAPTGVAAINAGGTTIHSFFQLPFTPFIPVSTGYGASDTISDKHSLIGRLRLTNDRKEVMQKLELLIIDEISMVRCDVLDAIDTVLRHVRSQYAAPFGGVQVLLIGDMYQLPPVVKSEEWQLLAPYYKSEYFFNSHVIELQQPVYIELNKIYRQNDGAFVQVLNQVRNNEMDQESYQLLHTRYLPAFYPAREENYITLTTHNSKADTINFKALNELDGKVFSFDATVEGEFYEKAFPADVNLKLKVGTQVMFLKNDIEKVRRYFNGKIGVVEKIEDDKIFVQCRDEPTPIEVKKEKWKNIRYSLDKTTNQIEENEIGSFTQFPLRLAWAITIHKSQGLTFEKAIIDAGEAFAPGQVYVALSRCTTLAGMILHSRINNHSLRNDRRISEFASAQRTSARQLQLLQQAKHLFQ
ncbi:MAG: AAA family ATPase, partial [Ferruginibacter sp.]